MLSTIAQLMDANYLKLHALPPNRSPSSFISTSTYIHGRHQSQSPDGDQSLYLKIQGIIIFLLPTMNPSNTRSSCYATSSSSKPEKPYSLPHFVYSPVVACRHDRSSGAKPSSAMCAHGCWKYEQITTRFNPNKQKINHDNNSKY